MRKQQEETEGTERYIYYAIWGFAVLIVLIVLFGSLYTIPAGVRGVLLTFGKPSMDAKTEGLHVKIPFIQQIIKMDVKTQKYTVEKASAASKDLQTVTTDVAINYYINPESTPQIYKTIGLDYQNKIIVPAVQEVVKASTARYTAEELITRRPEVKDAIDAGLRERLQTFGINVQAISITNFDFSAQFNTAVEGKVTAQQSALAALNKLEQVKYEAEQKVASAQAEAEALRLQKSQISPDLLQLRQIEVQSKALDVQSKAIDKWNGVLPQITGGATPFVSIGNLPTAQTSQSVTTQQ